jgi:hypothetical protein
VNDQQHRATDCPHRELAVGWALHALEPAGDSLVTAHLPDCPICTSTATQTEDVGATLGLSVPQAIPSAELEQRVLNVTGAKRKAPGVAPAPSTRPARHTIKRFWLRARGWLWPQR